MQVAFRALSQPSYVTDVPDDILEQLKRLKDGLDALTKWKEEVRQLRPLCSPHRPENKGGEVRIPCKAYPKSKV